MRWALPKILPLPAVLVLACSWSNVPQVSDENPNAKRVDQVCLDCAAGEKCVPGFRFNEPTNTVYLCVPEGAVRPGGACHLDSAGSDDCAGGAVCVPIGVADSDPTAKPPHRECRPYCASDADCPASETGASRCWGFAANAISGAAPPPGGFCVDTCAPFSNDCGDTGTCATGGNNVDGATSFLVCHFIGPGTSGSKCTDRGECGADMDCMDSGSSLPLFGPAPVCTQQCDATHDCPTGKFCRTRTQDEVGHCF